MEDEGAAKTGVEFMGERARGVLGLARTRKPLSRRVGRGRVGWVDEGMVIMEEGGAAEDPGGMGGGGGGWGWGEEAFTEVELGLGAFLRSYEPQGNFPCCVFPL